ncbi:MULTISPECIES: YheC/YheD family protein [unclassified Microcoleus]|uniref:ATP-grasp domain-containing protein n=1 Tax=unclassified Microcoleus TaxID=2642155 RepID=UPI002FD5D2D0
MQTNISLVLEACQELNISYEIIAPNQNLVRIKLNGQYYYFVNFSMPFNNEQIVHIFKDKEYTYQLLKDKIKTPKTLGFLSPFCEEKYHKYLEFKDCAEIAAEVGKTFSLPVIVKRNRGSAGNNVLLCETHEQVLGAIEIVFDVNSKNYDYVCLAQEYIDIRHEYRAVFFDRKLVLLYEKDKSDAKFAGNLSPLHWDGAKAKHITDSEIISEIENFVRPVFEEIQINYAGFDIALDTNGEYWLIEINSSPNYDIFVRDNDRQIAVTMFKDILDSLVVNKKP